MRISEEAIHDIKDLIKFIVEMLLILVVIIFIIGTFNIFWLVVAGTSGYLYLDACGYITLATYISLIIYKIFRWCRKAFIFGEHDDQQTINR